MAMFDGGGALSLLSLSLLFFSHLNAEIIDLGGRDVWTFHSKSGNISGLAAQVPGDIYADLQANGVIKRDPLFGEGDEELKWVCREHWVYQREFHLGAMAFKAEMVLLHLEGLDTLAEVFLNNQSLLSSDNQFLEWKGVNVKGFVVEGQNELRIEFASPILTAMDRQRDYEATHSHKLPPDCTAPVQNGECGVNFLRKIQASFSWDWGPSFPTVGIWKPIFLEYFVGQEPIIVDFSPLVVPKKDSFLVNSSISILCPPGPTQTSPIQVYVSIPELRLIQTQLMDSTLCLTPTAKTIQMVMEVLVEGLELWYPRGYGSQRMYTVEVGVLQNGNPVSKKNKSIGFRSIQLVQDFVDPKNQTKGRHFHFKVNGVPVFLKGSNYIPASAFPARDHSLRKAFLLHSAAEANLNVLRVWGGGMYEGEQDFYKLADQKGILVWQDLMFACALYPADHGFLEGIKREVEQQILRLRHHPSILVWAGNNENEVAIASNWWSARQYPKPQMIADYKALYRDVLKGIVEGLDSSRSFLLSSPSNGLRTEEEGGFSTDPQNPAFGDIHFYDDFTNLWKDYNYQIPRCATEFGVQSIPLGDTMLEWIDPSQWSYGSKSMSRRQHHSGGILTLLMLVYQHFELPKPPGCRVKGAGDLLSCQEFLQSPDYMDDFSFLSQVHQAVAVQVQSEHYRRWRSSLTDTGLGRTMCAMYWQLNDVWAAPSWSSVDFNLSWKMAHYFARRFFAPLIVSMYLDKEENLNVFVVSDHTTPTHNVSLQLEMFVIGNGFLPIYQTSKAIHIPALSSKRVELDGINVSEDDFILRAKLLDSNNNPLEGTFPAILMPDKLYARERFGEVKLTAFHQHSLKSYSIALKAMANIQPVVWLDLKAEVKREGILFHFSDNAFAMVEQELDQPITLTIYSNPKAILIKREDIVIRCL